MSATAPPSLYRSSFSCRHGPSIPHTPSIPRTAHCLQTYATASRGVRKGKSSVSITRAVAEEGGGAAPPPRAAGEQDESVSAARAAVDADSRIQTVELHEEASESYLAYAMSVIVGRALPDVRDGLKPVHRRILYSMHDLGLSSKKPFRKCARVVGEVLGKYHPHGDSAVYDALVRMAQDFSLRSPLINGHGNFGSLDADPPAAMRYTECKLTALSESMLLSDMDQSTVDFVDNFDASVQEPTVLPARLPHLLINGSQGIAVGMATKIPPHNLGEVVDALVALIRNPNATVQELMEHCPGPDFPTGGSILAADELLPVYQSGHGSLTLRGQARVEEMPSNRSMIVITEVPYQANKATLVETIANMVNSKTLEGVSDIRDESDRTGVRVVIEIKRGSSPQIVLNNLYKYTALQQRFSCNFVGLVNQKPQDLNLRAFLQVFLTFRCDVVERRARCHLERAEQKHHLVEGLLAAMRSLDEVVETIRKAADSLSAGKALQSGYGLTAVQADAVLAMPLRRLTSLEGEKLEGEHRSLGAEIDVLQGILRSKERVLEIVEREALELKEQFGTPRRTRLESEAAKNLADVDVIPNEDALILLSEKGYVKRMAVGTFSPQRKGGTGKSGGKLKSNDTLSQFLSCRTHDTLLFFSDRGIAYSLGAHQIPEASRLASGHPIRQLLPLQAEEMVTSMVPVSDFQGQGQEHLIMCTTNGLAKRVALSLFASVRKSGIVAIQLDEGAELGWVRLASEKDSVFVASAHCFTNHFLCGKLRPASRLTRGVKVLKLKEGDAVAAMDILPAGRDEHEAAAAAAAGEDNGAAGGGVGPCLLLITKLGLGKRVLADSFNVKNRGGQGVIACKLNEGDALIGMRVIASTGTDEEVVLGSHTGKVNRFKLADVSVQSRTARGIRVMKLDEDDFVKAVAVVPQSNIESDSEE